MVTRVDLKIKDIASYYRLMDVLVYFLSQRIIISLLLLLLFLSFLLSAFASFKLHLFFPCLLVWDSVFPISRH